MTSWNSDKLSEEITYNNTWYSQAYILARIYYLFCLAKLKQNITLSHFKIRIISNNIFNTREINFILSLYSLKVWEALVLFTL
jgi:hypothetical protein